MYTLFGDNGYVIAAIVVGEDDGVSSQYAYVYNDGADKEHWDKTNKEWTWTRDVIIDGEVVTLTEVGDSLSQIDTMAKNNWYEVKFKANGNVKSVTQISTNDAANHGEYVFCLTPEAANHPANGGAKYPKFVGKIELVQQAQVDNTSGKVVLFEDMYTTNRTASGDTWINYGDTLKYTLSTEGTSFQVKNATGGRVKGFAVSPNAKTVLIQDKRVVDNDGNPIGGIAQMDSREYFTGGKAGLESAIKRLNLNKAEDGKYFRGYVSAVFENGVAQTVIIYERLPNDVNWGTDIGNGSTTVTVANGVITVTPATLPGNSVSDEQLVAVRNKLAQLGYTDIKINRNGATGTVTSIEATKDNITTTFGTVGLNAATVQGLTVGTNPSKTVYTVGETIDLTGAVITANYGLGTINGVNYNAVDVTDDVAAVGDKSGTATLGATDTKIIVSFGGEKAEIAVTVKAVKDIAVKTNPTKTAYKVGETFDAAGSEVTITWSDNSTTDVAYADFAANGVTATATVPDTYTAAGFKATFAVGDKSAEANCTMTARTASASMAIATGSSATVDNSGGAGGTAVFNVTTDGGAKVTGATIAGATDTGATNATVAVSNGVVTVTIKSSATADTYTVTLSYTDEADGNAATATTTVTVTA